MTEENSENSLSSESGSTSKKPFVEPEIKEFDDLEKKIAMIGTFTP